MSLKTRINEDMKAAMKAFGPAPVRIATPAPAQEIPPDELERMSAFREFIESLDLSDFDKGSKPGP